MSTTLSLQDTWRMRCCRKVVLVVAVLLMSSMAWAAQAQHASLHGFVQAMDSRRALQNVNLVLRHLEQPGMTYGTATDADGYFVLPRLRPGRYMLRASFVGYETYQDTLALVAGTDATRTITLTPRESEMSEVVVEAEQTEGLTGLTAGLETIEPAEIERVPVPGVTGDLVGYLQTLPGIVTMGDRGGQFFVRGGRPTQNLALLDGIPLFYPFHILDFYSVFPAEIVDHADFYAGGYGATYGGRLASVLDVTARNGSKQRPAAMVSLAPFLSTLQMEGPIVPGRLSALVSIRESLVERLMPDLWGQRVPYRFGDRFGKVHALLTPRSSLALTVLHTYDRGDLMGSPRTFRGDEVPLAETDSNQVGWRNVAIGGRYVYTGRPLQAEATVSTTYGRNFFGPADDPERTATQRSYDAGLHLTYRLGSAALHAGGFARRLTLDYQLAGAFQALDTGAEELVESGGYVAAEVPLSGQVRVQPGLRLSAFRDRSVRVEPRVRAVWRPTAVPYLEELSAAWGIYHQQVVGLEDERDLGNVFTVWTGTPPGEAVPQAMHVLLGGRVSLPQGGAFSLEGYVKRLTNLWIPAWSAFPDFTTRLQPADGRVLGLDARFEITHKTFYGYAGYGLATVRYEAGEERFYPSHDRRHQLQLFGHYTFGPFALAARWQYGSGRPYTQSLGFDTWLLMEPGADVDTVPGRLRILYDRPNAARLPAYHRLDLWVEKDFEHGRLRGLLRAGAVNVYNRENLFYFDLFTLHRVDQLPLVPSVGLKLQVQ